MINKSADRDTDNIHRLYNCEELQQMYLHTIPAYVYYIRHIPTGKFYYGSRYKHISLNIRPEQDLWKTYFSSSKKVLELRKQDGNDSFEYKIIFESIDTDECFRFEQTIIKENVVNALCLNSRYFDIEKSKRIFSVFGKTLSTKGKPKSEETKLKMRQPKSIEHKNRISETQKANGGNGPIKHSEETKRKISQSGKGRIVSDATRKLTSLLHKGVPKPTVTCPECNKTGSKGPMHRFHFNNCKLRKNNE